MINFSKVMLSLLKEEPMVPDPKIPGMKRFVPPDAPVRKDNRNIEQRQQGIVGNKFLPNGRLRKPARPAGGQGKTGYQLEQIIKDGVLPKLKAGNYKHVDADVPGSNFGVKTDIFDDKGTGRPTDNTAFTVKTKRNNDYPMKVHQTGVGDKTGFGAKTYKKLKMTRGKNPLLDEAMDMYLGKGGNFVSPADMEDKHVKAIIDHLSENKIDVFNSIVRQAEHQFGRPVPYSTHDPAPIHKLVQHRNDSSSYNNLSGVIDVRQLAGKVNERNFEPLKWMHDGKRFFLGEEENAPTDKRMLDLWQIDEEGSNWTLNEGDGGPNPNANGTRGRGIVEPGHFKATMATNPEFLDRYFPVEKAFYMDDDGYSLGFKDLDHEPTAEEMLAAL